MNIKKITFIGGGNMSTALIGGLLKPTVDEADVPYDIHVIDVNVQALQTLAQQFGSTISTSTTMDAQVKTSDVLVFAVKPQHINDVLSQCQPWIDRQCVISIAAGIRMADLSRQLGRDVPYTRIVRAMPNTPALIGQGITGLVGTQALTPEDKALATSIFRGVGQTLWVTDESLIDAVTAISGSGPAYVFYLIEALQAAAVELGLSAEQGKTLALATFVGASQLALQSTEPVATLRERVTSKGGTTDAALTCLKELGVEAAIIKAAVAAAARAHALGERS